MKKFLETPHATTTDIIAGHFRERRGYATWRENGAQDWLLIYTVAGCGRFGYPAGEMLATPGDIVLLRPGTLHDYGVEPQLERWEILWAHFQPRLHWMDWLDWPQEAPGLMRLRLNQAARRPVQSALAEMYEHSRGAQSRHQDFAFNALERALLLCDAANPHIGHPQMDSRVRQTMDYLCRRLQDRITLDLLADRVNLSASRLAHLFREQTGTTPQQFLEIHRLDRAKQLLAFTPHAIKQVALQVGFENPFYFTLRFKRRTGKSPRAWRQAVAGRRRKSPAI